MSRLEEGNRTTGHNLAPGGCVKSAATLQAFARTSFEVQAAIERARTAGEEVTTSLDVSAKTLRLSDTGIQIARGETCRAEWHCKIRLERRDGRSTEHSSRGRGTTSSLRQHHDQGTCQATGSARLWWATNLRAGIRSKSSDCARPKADRLL